MPSSHGLHNAPPVSPSPDTCAISLQHISGQPSRNIVHEAYQSAVKFLGAEFANNEQAHNILSGATSIEDVEVEVKRIKDGYEMQPRRKRLVGGWLQKLSVRIMHFGSVLDALAQHHPEYVSLAWGAMKFVLMRIINHAELVEQFARALTCIGDVLPEIRLNAELYQTGHMEEAVSAVYTHIISFLLRATAWYKKQSLCRAFSSIIKPFELEYKTTVERVREHSEVIRRIANGKSKAEVRDIRIVIHQIKEQMQRELGEMRSQLEKVLKVSVANTAVVERIDHRVEDIQPRIHDLQYSSIVAALRPSADPKELLYQSGSLIRRRQMKSVYPCTISSILDSLKEWAGCPASSLFVLRPGPRADSAAREVTVNIINHVSSAKQNVFWNVSSLGYDGASPSVASVLKSLVFQVITAKPDVLLRFSGELNAAKFSSRHSDAEWVDLLSLVISRVGGCFLIVECENLYRLCSGRPGWSHAFLMLFHQLADKVQASGSWVKILVADFEKTATGLQGRTGDSPRIVAALKRPVPVPARLRRKGIRSNYSRSSPRHRVV